jgi:Zn-dependent metalloprotease
MKSVNQLVGGALLFVCLISTGQAGTGDGNAAIERARNHLKPASALVAQDGDEDLFMARDLMVEQTGAEHVRFNRLHKGLRVIGGDVVVHSDSRGALLGISRTLGRKLNVHTKARFDDDAAETYAASLFGGIPSGHVKSELVVYARNDVPLLAWDVTIHGKRVDHTPSEAHIIIDAGTLQLLDRWDDVHTAASNGTGNTLLSGNVALVTDSISGGYALRDPSRGSHYVTNMSNKTSGNGTIYTDADNIWGNNSTSSGVTIAADAQYGQNKTFDYYKSQHARNGIANDGRGGYSRVHYSRNYVNAFWSDSCFCMTYGDGDGSTYLPLVALDVAGHEMTHGVTANSAGLIYSGESGGLNEATSDIFGTMVEFYAANAALPGTTANYLIGERIYASQKTTAVPTKALRFMFKPSLDGSSPDCYSSTVGSLDVHYSSAIANHFFYLLAEGATVPAGFSSLTKSQLVCNGNTALAGIGRTAAAKIYYRALTVYMTSNTKYASARTATLNAATDLYGSSSTQRAAVAAAWSAVGVN